MKRVLFLASHPGANAEQLAALLEHNQCIQFYHTNSTYKHPSDIAALQLSPHKNTTTAAIYAALLLDNNNLSGRSLYKFCHFVYFICGPKFAITELVKTQTMKNAVDLYVLRIRRLYEMAVQSPEAVFLTWDNIQGEKGLNLIENHFHLKTPLQYNPDGFTEPKDCVLSSYLQEAEEAYEGIIYRMRQLKHISQCQ
ncbi:MAG: hypothetical protein M0R80_08485 [Proteobacteria bacterium]|jgi:hypothetical protein|nr:hypothetical protein [Pseudomonadota bacterium]